MSFNKVTIVGNSASGKSSLSVPLGAKLGLPVFHTDFLLCKPNWVVLPESQFIAAHLNWLMKPQWLIEGISYRSAMLQAFSGSDAIIFLDTPYEMCIERARKRTEEDRIVKNQFVPDYWHYRAIDSKQIENIRHFHEKTRLSIFKLLSGVFANKPQFVLDGRLKTDDLCSQIAV